MKFATLTKSQKRFVVSAIAENSALAKKTEVTRAEILEVYWALRNARTGNEPKVGLPNWLMNTAKTGRGTYVFPAPTSAELQEFNIVATPVKTNTTATAKARKRLDTILKRLDTILEKGTVVEPVVTVSDEEFLKELQDAGIEV